MRVDARSHVARSQSAALHAHDQIVTVVELQAMETA